MDRPGQQKIARWTVVNELVDPPELTSPTAMNVVYGPENGTMATLNYPTDGEIVEDATGTFHLIIDCPTAGIWVIRVAATEGVVAVEETNWTVKPSLIPT